LSRIELGKINTSIYHVFVISETLEVKIHDIFKEVYKSNGNGNVKPSSNGSTGKKSK
jgi:DNA-binding XRE family transcriptional regulator